MHISFISEKEFEYPDNRISEYIDLEALGSEKKQIAEIMNKLLKLKNEDNTFFIDPKHWLLFWFMVPQIKQFISQDCFLDVVYKSDNGVYECKNFDLKKELFLN